MSVLGLPCVQNHHFCRGAAIGNAMIPTRVRRRLPQNKRELTMRKKVILQREKTEHILGGSTGVDRPDALRLLVTRKSPELTVHTTNKATPHSVAAVDTTYWDSL